MRWTVRVVAAAAINGAASILLPAPPPDSVAREVSGYMGDCFPRARSARARQASAFTLVETLIVVAILCILAALAIGNYDRIVASAQQAVCASHMRSIHTALNLYLQDNKNVWPQAPEITQERAWEDFWIDTLRPFGIGEKTWQCPTINAILRAAGREATKVHYAPTRFDTTPGIAYRWPTQPWLIERANAHGQGAIICFPDGSLQPLRKFLASQGQQ